MDKFTNKICLEKLAEGIGIPVVHGWKKELSERLNQKRQTIISTWITRGVPEEFDRILRTAGIDPAIWSNILVNVLTSPAINSAHEETKTAVPQDSDIIKLQADYIEALKEINILRERIRQLEESKVWTGKERRGTG
jgi:hypothetical protein